MVCKQFLSFDFNAQKNLIILLEHNRVNQWIDKLLFFPLSNPMEFSKLIPQDILTHFVKPLPPKPIEDIQEIDENRTDSSLEEYFAFDSGSSCSFFPKNKHK